MTQLLISVRNVEEARIVSDFPVAIIDVKEPKRGALGSASVQTLGEIAAVVDPSRTLSFSAGELADWDDAGSAEPGGSSKSIVTFYESKLLESFAFIKIGLASMQHLDWKNRWLSLFDNLPDSTSAVAVAYLDFLEADSPRPKDVVEFATNQKQCSAILFDTFNKSQNLFHSVSKSEFKELVKNSQRHGKKTVVAGSVDFDCLPEVFAARPDFIGLRGAVCRTDRASVVDTALLGQWVNAFNSYSEPSESKSGEFRSK